MFEAVNAVTGEYKPYLGTINATRGASAEAAAVAAAYRALATYFPASLPTLNAARASSLGSIPDGSAKDAGIAVGEAAANAMITLPANDGSAPPEFYVPPAFEPGQWQVTPSCPPAGGTLLQWRNVTPFGLRQADQFRSEPRSSTRSITTRSGVRKRRSISRTSTAMRAPTPTRRTRRSLRHRVFRAIRLLTATLSNAAREVLERLFGRHHRSITISSSALNITITYQTLREITDDISDASVYGGIHFRFDQDEGAEQGRHVGQYIYHHFLRRDESDRNRY